MTSRSAGPRSMASSAPGFKSIKRFKQHFADCVALAVAAYPEARVSISSRGMILQPSRPAIAKA